MRKLREIPESNARQKAASARDARDASCPSMDDGRTSAYPSSRAYRPERVSNVDGFDAPSSVRHSQRASRAPVAVRAGDSVLPPEPRTVEPCAVDGHPLDRQEDTNPGLGSIRGMGAPLGGASRFDGDPTVLGNTPESWLGEEGTPGPASAVPASAERVRGSSRRVTVTRLEPMVVSERERSAARAELARHRDVRPGTVRGLGAFFVAPALDAALYVDEGGGGCGALALTAREPARVEALPAGAGAEPSTDWAPGDYLEFDPEYAFPPPKRWVAPLVGVVLLVAAGVLVFAAGQRLLETRRSGSAKNQTPIRGDAYGVVMAIDGESARRAAATAPASEPGDSSAPASRTARSGDRESSIPQNEIAVAEAAPAPVSSALDTSGALENAATGGLGRAASAPETRRSARRVEQPVVKPSPAVPIQDRVPDETIF